MNALTTTARIGWFLLLLTQGATVHAAEITVITLPAYKSLLEKLNPVFTTTTGHTLVIESGLFSQLKARIDAGDFDVAISSGAITDYLESQGKALANKRIEFSNARSRTCWSECSEHNQIAPEPRPLTAKTGVR
jgi:ABC-type molybdate transport system substrate-binding protein